MFGVGDHSIGVDFECVGISFVADGIFALDGGRPEFGVGEFSGCVCGGGAGVGGGRELQAGITPFGEDVAGDFEGFAAFVDAD